MAQNGPDPGVPVSTNPLDTSALDDLIGGATGSDALVKQMAGMDPKMLNALAVITALRKQKAAERTETPFPYPGQAMKTNNLAAEEKGYAPSGTIFTGGVPYKPNYGAQEAAAAGMLLSNVMEAYAKNKQSWQKSQGNQP